MCDFIKQTLKIEEVNDSVGCCLQWTIWFNQNRMLCSLLKHQIVGGYPENKQTKKFEES